MPRKKFFGILASSLSIIILFMIFLCGIITLDLSPAPTMEFDTIAPEITLNGENPLIIKEGDDFNDPGAKATDNNEEIEVTTSGKVNASDPGNYLISYTATDATGNVATKSRVVTVIPRNHGTIYLTFDDGPGIYTATLLDILNKYNVKATFFVTGAGDDNLLRREYNEGHAIGLHTFSHNYSYIYTSIDNFFEDLYKIQNRVKNVTGYTSYLMRFPGGSSNTISSRYDGGQHIMSKLVEEVKKRGFIYFDWNVTSGDAGGTTSSTGVYQNVINRVIKDGNSVVLQHDIKKFSVAAVERIIKWGLENGYTFKKLDNTSFTAHHGVNN